MKRNTKYGLSIVTSLAAAAIALLPTTTAEADPATPECVRLESSSAFAAEVQANSVITIEDLSFHGTAIDLPYQINDWTAKLFISEGAVLYTPTTMSDERYLPLFACETDIPTGSMLLDPVGESLLGCVHGTTFANDPGCDDSPGYHVYGATWGLAE